MQTLFHDEVMPAPSVPHSGPARADLQKRFARRLQVNPQLSRKLVSYQGNKGAVGFRWLKYKEGFSTALVRQFIERGQGTQVLDPFSGAGTTALTAMSMGIPATGIEILPLGTLAAQTVAYAANGLPLAAFRTAAHDLLCAIAADGDDGQYALTHVPITQGAFPGSTDHEIARARKFIAALTDPAFGDRVEPRLHERLGGSQLHPPRTVSFLRWDPRSGRTVSTKLNKGPLPSFATALTTRLQQMMQDFPLLKEHYAGPFPTFITGSSLTELHKLDAGQFDCVVTSPPYANRYDYTRTYALELVYMGYDDAQIKALRQALLSATVGKPL